MSLTTILVAIAATAVNFGWQKYDDGYEYLVQLEPETLRLLQDEGEVPIDSHVPKDVQPIRRVRIVVGRAELPRELISDDEAPQSDGAVERSAYFRPEDPAPPANSRYSQPTAPTSTLDKIVQPLRDADNFLERGFEAGVDGLENTGQSIRGTVGNVGAGVQQHLQRTKEALVGSAPKSGAPATNPATNYNVVAPGAGYGNAPAWQTEVGTTGSPSPAPLSNLPPPPLAGEEPAASSAPNSDGTGAPATDGPILPDNRNGSAPANGSFSATIPGFDAGNRMVPIDPIDSKSNSTTAEPPAWAPWPGITTVSSSAPSTPSTEWPPTTDPGSSPPAQPVATAGTPQPTTVAPPATQVEEAATTSAPANGQSLTGWFLAIVGLAGSIGCNFFLGVSYLDIRNKYRAVLRRTSRSFVRQATSA